MTARPLRFTLGDNLRILMERRGTTCGATARALGWHRWTLSRFINGEAHPRPDQLRAICDHFGVDARVYLQPLAELEAA